MAFATSGIIAERNMDASRLGKPVTGFALDALYAKLGTEEIAPVGGVQVKTGRLVYDSVQINALFKTDMLFRLRNEPLAALLDQAILRRQNRYLEQYKYIGDMAAEVATCKNAKVAALKQIQKFASDMSAAIDKQYAADKLDRVTKPVVSTVVAEDMTQTGTVGGETLIAGVGTRHPDSKLTVSDATDQPQQFHKTPVMDIVPIVFNATPAPGAWTELHQIDKGNPYVAQESTNTFDQHLHTGGTLTATSENEPFRHPAIENRMRDKRMQTDLGDELLIEQLTSHRLDSLPTIWANELKDIDQEIRKLQLAYIATFLVAPFDARVSTVYKDAGESASAGEAIIRIEQEDKQVLIVGTMIFRAPVHPQSAVTITTTDTFGGAPSQPITLAGTVVSVRGHEAEYDRWDIILECANRDTGGTDITLPLNYNFDRDLTTITI